MKKILILSVALVLVSCGGGDDKASDPKVEPKNFSIKKYNETLVEDFYISTLAEAIKSNKAIIEKTKNCKADFSRTSVQANWKALVLGVSKIEPLLSAGLVDQNSEAEVERIEKIIGGSYSASPCEVQKNMIEKHKAGSNYLKRNPLVNSLEILLYSDLGHKNFCFSDADVEGWVKNAPEKNRDLCEGVQALSLDLQTNLEAWEKRAQNLLKDPESNLYSEDFLQKVYDSLNIFVDQRLKDDKMATPLGQSASCGFPGQLCPTAVEFRSSQMSFEALAKNLEGMMYIFDQQREVLSSPQNQGLQHFLNINKKSEVAQKVYSSIQESFKKTQDLIKQNKSFENLVEDLNKEDCENTSLENNLVPVCSLYLSVKKLSDYVKTDLRLALALSKTQQTAGDSD